MVDWVKKITRAEGDAIAADEELVAGVFAHPAGGFARQVAGGAVGGVIGAITAEAMAAKRAGAHDGADEQGMASAFPGERTVLGLTARRLLVFGHSQFSGKPKDLKAEFAVTDLDDVLIEKKKLSHRMVVTFADGSLVDLDVPRMGGDAESFKAAFDRVKGRA